MIPVIFINCKHYPFVKWIEEGTKKYETRNRNTLYRFIGERVLIAETGHGKPVVKCSAVISQAIELFTEDAWRKHVTALDVPLFSEYDWQPGTRKKVLYKLTDVQPVTPFTPDGRRHGRVWMECNQTPDSKPMSNTDRLETIGCFIDIFEDFLEEKGIDIINPEKEQDENAAIIYGTDYGILEDQIESLLINIGALSAR